MEVTEFGCVVGALMAERGVRSQAELVRRFENHGYKLTQQRLSHWMVGRYAVAKDFPERLSEVLSLTEEQRVRLAMGYAFGQNQTAAARLRAVG